MQLTPDQEKQLQEYKEKFQNISMSTTPGNKQEAEDAILTYYKQIKVGKTPKFHWVKSPDEGAKLVATLHRQYKNQDTSKVTDEEVLEAKRNCNQGSFDTYWAAYYSFVHEVLGKEKHELLDISMSIINNVGPHWLFDKNVILCEKPVEIHCKDGVLHNTEGLALKWSDGSGVYVVNNKKYDSMMALMLDNELSTESNNMLDK